MKRKYFFTLFVTFVCIACLNACSNASSNSTTSTSSTTSTNSTASTSSTTSTNSTASTSSDAPITDVELPEWTEDLEYQIKKAFYKTLFGDDANFDINEISMAYYGSYSGYEAVLNTGLGGDKVTRVEVGGHLFQFGTTNVILLYKNDTFIKFQDAFHEGKITQEDIDMLYEAYKRMPN